MKQSILCNRRVRNHARKKEVRLWELADALGVSQATITRRLRYELGEHDTADYIAAIDTIAAARTAG